MGVVAGMNDGLASTFGGGMFGWTVDGGNEGWLTTWHGTECTGGFNWRSLDGRLGSGARGLQLLATLVSSLLS